MKTSALSKPGSKKDAVRAMMFERLMGQINALAQEAMEYLPEGRSLTGALGAIGFDLMMEKYAQENKTRMQLKFVPPAKRRGRPAKKQPYTPCLLLMKPQPQPESEVLA